MKQQSNWKLGLKLIGTHFTAIVVSLIVVFSFVTLINNNIIRGLISLVILFFYISLVGTHSWNIGNEDLHRVNSNRMKMDKLRGVKIGLVASIPMFFMALLLVLAKVELLPNTVFLAFRLLNAHILLPIMLINDSTVITNISWAEFSGIIALLFVTPISTGLYYLFGFKDIVIMDSIVYKKKK